MDRSILFYSAVSGSNIPDTAESVSGIFERVVQVNSSDSCLRKSPERPISSDPVPLWTSTPRMRGIMISGVRSLIHPCLLVSEMSLLRSNYTPSGYQKQTIATSRIASKHWLVALSAIEMNDQHF